MAVAPDFTRESSSPLPPTWGGAGGEDNGLRPTGFVIWLASLALWVILSLADAVDYYAGWRFAGEPASFARAMAGAFPGWMLWAGLAPLIYLVCRRVRLSWPPRASAVAVHLAMSLLVGAIHTAVHASAGWYFAARPSRLSMLDYYSASLFDWMPINMLVYWAVVGTFYGLDYYRRYQATRFEATELAQRLTEARLAALQSQLHPHFLFNTLNAAVALVRTDNGPGAVQVLTQLGDILRHLLHGTSEPEISLADELAFLERYLAIEQIRFSNRLRVTVQVPPDLGLVLVPNLILQPLVENAIRHGLAADEGGGNLTISAVRIEQTIRLEVRNDGPPLPQGWSLERSAGVGLNNTRSRLSHLHGNAASLALASDAPSGVRATVILPLRFAQPTAPQ